VTTPSDSRRHGVTNLVEQRASIIDGHSLPIATNQNQINYFVKGPLQTIRVLFNTAILLFLASATVSGEQVLDSLPTEELITKLTEESNQGIGSHTTAWASGFLAIDDEPRFSGGMLGSAKPVASPVMRELVRRGLAGLPLLINHLTDSRPTKLTVGDGFTGKWFADEYDARDSTSTKFANLNTRRRIDFENYTLRVGDLCYVAVGQIVNRELNAVRYQPSQCLVVNSPVEFPALAAAVKRDWGTLTAQDHQLSLEQDSMHPHSSFAPGAGLKRLAFYYPEAGERWMLRILKRPFYNRRAAFNFFEKTLAGSKSSEWDQWMSRFRAKYGETEILGVLHWTLNVYRFPESQMTDERRKKKETAAQVLGRFFPNIDPLKPPFINGVSTLDQWSLLEDLAAIESKAVKDAVLTILQNVVAQPPEDDLNDRFYQCALAYSCAKRLDDESGHGGQTRALLESMIEAFKKGRKSRDAEGRAAFDKNIQYLRDAILATKGG
jgi:hypothetical protein